MKHQKIGGESIFTINSSTKGKRSSTLVRKAVLWRDVYSAMLEVLFSLYVIVVHCEQLALAIFKINLGSNTISTVVALPPNKLKPIFFKDYRLD